MKRSGTTIIFVIVWVAVLLGAYGLGLCIREVRFRHAGIEAKAVAGPQASTKIEKPVDTNEPERGRAKTVEVPPEMRLMPRLGQRLGRPREGMAMFQMLPPEEAAQLRERWPNMSEEERERFRTQMRERWENMSEEERQQLIERRRAEMQQRRARFENMTEQEREKFRAEMRERFGGRASRRRR
ncbi:MAG: hypothetical protein ACE5NM_02530 [Sedimentisphaerales bacterium]